MTSRVLRYTPLHPAVGMLRFVNAANAITLLGLCAALACTLLAASGHLAYAISALILSGLCDFFDGAVGRRIARSDDEITFGGRLDSLVDACSFGMAPAVLFHAVGLRTPLELTLVAGFTTCAIWRLAYFDTVGFGADGDRRTYTGLPTTFVALVLPLAFLTGFAGPGPLRAAANASAVLLAAAMVSSVKIPKPGGAWYGIFLLLALVVGGTYVAQASHFPGGSP